MDKNVLLKLLMAFEYLLLSGVTLGIVVFLL